eukprot:354823-Chlamydomonas_euryale.AAC.1
MSIAMTPSAQRSASTQRESPTFATCSDRPRSMAHTAVVPDMLSSRRAWHCRLVDTIACGSKGEIRGPACHC